MKTRYAIYRCSSVIHNFPSSLGIERSVQANLAQMLYSCCASMQQAVEGWYDTAALLPYLIEQEKPGSLCGGRIIDAETCDNVATG